MGLALKLWLSLMIPMVLGFGIYGWAAHQNRQRVLLGEASAELRNYATLVEAATERTGQSWEVERVRARLEQLTRADRVLGVAIFDSDGQAGPITADIARGSSKDELARFARRTLESGSDLEAWLTLADKPVLVRSILRPDRAFVTVVARDMTYLGALSSSLNRGLVVMALLVLAFAAAASALVTRRLVGIPVGRIVEGADRVAAGHLETKVDEPSTRELAWLAQAFNAMTTSLGEAWREAKRQAEARTAMERRVQRTQALAVVGQVAASIAHEIGSPLNVILGRSLRAAGREACDPASRREFETIAVQSERISRVVQQLLSAARPARPEPGSSNLVAVAREAVEFLEPDCRARGVDLRVEPGFDEARVSLDRDRAFQVVLNLCVNATQAQKSGGKVHLRVFEGEPVEGARTRFVLEVEDWGPGIPPDQAPHIFDAFFTSKQDEGGTGLGLAVVKGIVGEAGGHVELVSKAGPGALFRVVLPSPAPDDGKTLTSMERSLVDRDFPEASAAPGEPPEAG